MSNDDTFNGGEDARLARFRVSNALIAQMLNLPDGAKITSVENDTNNPECVVLFVEHWQLDMVKNGELIPEVNPTYTTVHFDWGIDGKR